MLSRLQLSVAFVLEVTEGPRQRKRSVNSAFFHEAARALDSLFLFRVVRFVIHRHIDGAASFGQDSTRVTSVGADDLRA